MAKLGPKEIQKELEQGLLWPFYWIYGAEAMRGRELLNQLRIALFGKEKFSGQKSALSSGENAAAGGLLSVFSEERLDGGAVSVSEILDQAQSLSLGGGPKLVVVRDAHLIKNAEDLEPLFGKRDRKENLSSVCVFFSKDLDGRKKFSKTLVERAAVVACEEIPEHEREAWILYFAKKRGLTLGEETLQQLASIDPWGLEIMERELEKLEVASLPPAGFADPLEARGVLQGAGGGERGGEAFLDAFLSRDVARSFRLVKKFSESPEESLPLLGLLAWNVRHLALFIAERKQGGGERTLRLSPFIVEKLQRWSSSWALAEVLVLQAGLEELDFGIKQTFQLPLGLWGNLVVKFCQQQKRAKDFVGTIIRHP